MATCSHEHFEQLPDEKLLYATNTGLIVTVPASYRCAWCALVMHYTVD